MRPDMKIKKDPITIPVYQGIRKGSFISIMSSVKKTQSIHQRPFSMGGAAKKIFVQAC
jgi:hypothetical protein